MSSIINQINDDKNYKYEKTKTTFALLIALISLRKKINLQIHDRVLSFYFYK